MLTSLLLFCCGFGHRPTACIRCSHGTSPEKPPRSSFEASWPAKEARIQAAQRPSAGLIPSTWICEFWAQKVRPFLVSESEPTNGGPWPRKCKDLYCGLGKRDHIWSRILSPNLVSLFGPEGPKFDDPSPQKKIKGASFSCGAVVGSSRMLG